jgi:hypothetical protein
MAMGASSNRYIKGWESADEERMGDNPQETQTVTPRSEKSPMDYLNKDGF